MQTARYNCFIDFINTSVYLIPTYFHYLLFYVVVCETQFDNPNYSKEWKNK